jgi:phage gp36-like protein
VVGNPHPITHNSYLITQNYLNMFLSQADYMPQIQPEIKQAVASDPTIWSSSELQAQEEIEGYLRNRYDVANIFNKVGTARNQRIVMLMVDIALYHTVSRLAPRNIPELREVRYEQAIDWLKAVNKGTVTPDLPLIPDTANGGFQSELRLGSNKKLTHYY